MCHPLRQRERNESGRWRRESDAQYPARLPHGPVRVASPQIRFPDFEIPFCFDRHSHTDRRRNAGRYPTPAGEPAGLMSETPSIPANARILSALRHRAVLSLEGSALLDCRLDGKGIGELSPITSGFEHRFCFHWNRTRFGQRSERDFVVVQIVVEGPATTARAPGTC